MAERYQKKDTNNRCLPVVSRLFFMLKYDTLPQRTSLLMITVYPLFLSRLLLLVFAITLTSCTSIAQFDSQSYKNAVNTKVSALALMDKATTPYEQNKTEINALYFSLNQGYEYANGIPKNEITTAQWAIMKDPERNLLGGFLKRWQEKKTLKPAFINSAKTVISDGFDAIIGLESGKINPADVTK